MNQTEKLVQEKKENKLKNPKLSPGKKAAIIMACVAILALGLSGISWYINDYYRATEKADKAMLGSQTVKVIEEEEYYLFQYQNRMSTYDLNPQVETKAIIFYPGGKVEETAYAPLMLSFAEAGYDVYLVKMPARLAILGMDRADAIIENAPEVTEWTMMGHSLGGAMAASFIAGSDREIANLILLAAYSTEDLSDEGMDIYSFYGSEDKVLNAAKYEEYRGNLTEDVIETVIDGGNHAYYGHYGEQDGDGTASITRAEQQQTVLDVFLSLEGGITP